MFKTVSSIAYLTLSNNFNLPCLMLLFTMFSLPSVFISNTPYSKQKKKLTIEAPNQCVESVRNLN